jgi:3-oxoacyl-[acyl-carrier-protein] synthase-3
MEQESTLNKRIPLPLKILGLGSYLPGRVVTNNELETKYGLENQWCENHLGIRERHWAEEERPSQMGAAAAREAIANAGMESEDIDLIINASVTTSLERVIPEGAALIQQQLGIEDSGIPCFTMQNNCLSFMMALDTSAALLNSGRYQNILIVSAEIFSSNLDFTNPGVFGFYGDAAGAAVVTLPQQEESSAIINALFATYGHGVTYLQSKIGMTMLQDKELTPADLTLQMDTDSVIEYGNRCTENLISKLFENDESVVNNIKLVVSQHFGKNFPGLSKLPLPRDRFISIIKEYGFCGAATIPLSLYEAVKQARLQRGDLTLLLGQGAGLSMGGLVMHF